MEVKKKVWMIMIMKIHLTYIFETNSYVTNEVNNDKGMRRLFYIKKQFELSKRFTSSKHLLKTGEKLKCNKSKISLQKTTNRVCCIKM